MFNMFVKLFFRSTRIIKGFVNYLIRDYVNFVIPNLEVLLTKRTLYEQIPTCHQKTLLTGKGIVKIGKNNSFGYKHGGHHHGGRIEIQPRYINSTISFGNNVITSNNLFMCAACNIEIGDNTLIGNFVSIRDFDAHMISPKRRNEIGDISSVKIGNNVWIGNNVSILKNSEIGNNSIIALGAVVSGKFPANVIIGGVPAKIIKRIQ